MLRRTRFTNKQIDYTMSTEEPNFSNIDTTRKRSHTLTCILPNPVKRRRKTNNIFFQEGNSWCNVQTKQTSVSEGDKEEQSIFEKTDSETAFPCQVPQCQKMFTSVSQYECHYNSAHRYVCNHCHRTLPTSHLLDIHVLEWHDTMFELLIKKKPMYDCLISECCEKFWTSQDRKEHLIQIHKYPANFRFDKTAATKEKTGKTKDKRKEMGKLKDTKSKGTIKQKLVDNAESSPLEAAVSGIESCVDFVKHDINQDNCDSNIDIKEGKPSKRIPKNICFGQGSQKAFHSGSGGKKKTKKKHWHQQVTPDTMDTTVNIEEVAMDDLATALDT